MIDIDVCKGSCMGNKDLKIYAHPWAVLIH